MRIGIDIDDVIVDLSKFSIGYSYKYEHLFCDNHEITNNLKDLVRGNLINESMKKFVKTYSSEVWKNVEVKQNAIRVLNRLKSKGNQLIIITSRNNNMNSEAEKITYEYFKKNEIPYDKMLFGTHDKKQTCLDEKVKIFIDDSVDSCDDILSNTNITVYLFDSIINKNLKCDAKRVHNWLELEEIIDTNS